MITKILLLILIGGVSLIFIIDVFLAKEKVAIDEKTSEYKNPYYTWSGYYRKQRDYDYVYFGETQKHGRPLYIYKKYATKYKFDKINWEEIKYVLRYLNSIVLIMVFICVLFISFISYNNSKRVDMLEHQRNYVNELNDEVDTIVKSFMEHEEITFDRDVSLEALIITYPELRSVELVTNQLETLKHEKQKLNELELSIIKYKTIKKWFGLK